MTIFNSKLLVYQRVLPSHKLEVAFGNPQNATALEIRAL